jgi:hypothetical protein
MGEGLTAKVSRFVSGPEADAAGYNNMTSIIGCG